MLVGVQDIIQTTRPPLTENYVMAIVMENKDPEKIGRIKIRIPEIYEPDKVGLDKMPWVRRMSNSFQGGKPETGEFAVPEIGSTVLVVFKNMIVYEAYYIHADTSKNHKSSKFDKDYPKSYGEDDGNGTWWRVTKDDDYIFHHRSGTQWTIDRDGNVRWDIVGTLTVNVQKGTYFNDAVTFQEFAPLTIINGDIEPDG